MDHLTFLSTIASPHLRRITLTSDVSRSVKGGELDSKVLAHDGWETVEEILLQLAAKSRDVIEVVVLLFLRANCPSSVLESGTFMSRFKEVGKVEVRFLQQEAKF